MCTNIMQNLILKGLNARFKITATTQYITQIKDSTKKGDIGTFKFVYPHLKLKEEPKVKHEHKKRFTAQDFQ